MDSVTILLMVIAKPILDLLFRFIVLLFFTEYQVESVSEVKKYDRVLVEGGFCSSIIFDGPVRLPGLGLHFLPARYPTFFYKIRREDGLQLDNYYVYTSKRVMDSLRGKSDGDKYMTCVVSSLVQGNCTIYGYKFDLPGPINEKQLSIVNEFTNVFLTKRKLSLFLSGEMGTGKTKLAWYLANEINNASNGMIVPNIMLGFNPLAKGLYFNLHLIFATERTPVILILDEFDRMAEFAEENNESQSGSQCIAQNRTSFLTFLDLLNELDNFILIGTSNKDLIADGAYTRKGRFDYHRKF